MSSSVLDMLSAISGVLPAIDDGSLRLSYADVQRSVSAERRWFQSMKVRRCALLAENSARWILSDLALLASEALNVSLPPWFSPELISQVLDDVGVDSVLTDAAERFTQDHPSFGYVARSHRTGLSLLRRAESSVPSGSLPAGLSKVVFTSSGAGVRLRYSAIRSVIDSLVTEISGLGLQTHMCLLPLATPLENIAGVYVSLTMGAKVVARPRHTMGLSAGELNVPLLLQAIDAASPASLTLVPELLRALIDAAGSGWRVPASLKLIALGGTVSPALLQEARQAGLPHPSAEMRVVSLGASDPEGFVYLRGPSRS